MSDSSPHRSENITVCSDSYWSWHRQLEADGKLNHAAEDCPERRGLDVHDWTPERGWMLRRVTVR